MNDQHDNAGYIVVGVDGSESSRQALRWAARQAALTGSAVEAVSVWQLPDTWPRGLLLNADLEGHARAVLHQAVTETLGPDPQVTVREKVRGGNVAEVLIEVAIGADLLVLGSHGTGGFAGALLGSVGQHATQHARCPVVIVRNGKG